MRTSRIVKDALSLDGHRKAIDALDREILARLNARARHAQAIGELKGGALAYRPEREAQVLARLHAENAGPLSQRAVTGIFREVMSACLRARADAAHRLSRARPARSATPRSRKHFGTFVDAVPCADDRRRVPRGRKRPGRLRRGAGRELDRGRGRPHARPHVPDTDSSICGEVKLRVHQNLLSNAGGARRGSRASTRTRSRSRNACSGSRSICRRCRAIAVASNAEAARLAAAEPGAAAIAGENAAAHLRARDARAAHRGRAQQHDALLGARPPARSAPSGRDETSLVMSCAEPPGRGAQPARAVRDARRVDVALRVAAGAHRAVGVPVLRRPRRPSRRRRRSRRRSPSSRKTRRSSSCWDRIPRQSIRS